LKLNKLGRDFNKITSAIVELTVNIIILVF